ncbi:hypothetical protein Tco_1297108 [Tanacetum coccineum]
MTTPSPSPPISLSPPSVGERLARMTSTQALIDAVTAALPSPPLPPSLYIPPPVDHRDEIPESEQLPHNRPTRGRGIDYGFVSTVDAEERRQGIRDVGYGIRDTWLDPAKAVPEITPITVGEVNTRVTELAELHEHDIQDLYTLLEDAQDSRSRILQRVDLLMGDRMTFQETATHQELQTHHDHVYAHETHLQAHQTQLQLQSTLIQTQHPVHETHFQMQQAELAALLETDRPEARIPDHQGASGDADSHI